MCGRARGPVGMRGCWVPMWKDPQLGSARAKVQKRSSYSACSVLCKKGGKMSFLFRSTCICLQAPRQHPGAGPSEGGGGRGRGAGLRERRQRLLQPSGTLTVGVFFPGTTRHSNRGLSCALQSFYHLPGRRVFSAMRCLDLSQMMFLRTVGSPVPAGPRGAPITLWG